MDFIDFLREMLGITSDFVITSIVKDEDNKHIKMHLHYLNTFYEKEGKTYKLYDRTPEREWQHLNWFEYRCYLVSSLPRYISDDGKPKVIDINFAPKSKGYTNLFALKIIEALQKNRKIQAVMIKARGFVNFERFRVNTLFYFGKLNLMPQKFTNACFLDAYFLS